MPSPMVRPSSYLPTFLYPIDVDVDVDVDVGVGVGVGVGWDCKDDS